MRAAGPVGGGSTLSGLRRAVAGIARLALGAGQVRATRRHCWRVEAAPFHGRPRNGGEVLRQSQATAYAPVKRMRHSHGYGGTQGTLDRQDKPEGSRRSISFALMSSHVSPCPCLSTAAKYVKKSEEITAQPRLQRFYFTWASKPIAMLESILIILTNLHTTC